MTKPAVWNGDPECGHDVANAFQTHYCTYIRVPRLLSLQIPADPGTRAASDELILITSYQWYELWFKVLVTDLRAALDANPETYEPIKLLRRGTELFRLLERYADLAESILVRGLKACKRVHMSAGEIPSAQFRQLETLVKRLTRSAKEGPLVEAAGEYLGGWGEFRDHFAGLVARTLEPARRAPSYDEWLHVPELLSLQNGVKAAWMGPDEIEPASLMQPEQIRADENMFIVVHQCFEVWFKVMLDQIDRAIPSLLRGEVEDATRRMRRVAELQSLLVQQIEMPATMLPLDFLLFRHQTEAREGKPVHTGLSPASGTESYQFREIEIVCGLRDDPVFRKYLAGTDKLPIRLLTPRQAERMHAIGLPQAFREALDKRGVEELRALFTPADRPNPNRDLAELADILLQFDQEFLRWRIGHVSMVERMIGARSGTGFLGPEYLMETAGIRIQKRNRVFKERQVRPRFFPELWDVRSQLEPPY